MTIKNEVITITCAGGAGTSTGAGETSQINGWPLGVYIDHSATAASSTRVTLKSKNHPGFTILDVQTSKTDMYYPIRVDERDSSGAATGNLTLMAMNDRITIAVTGNNNGETVTLDFHWSQE